MKRDYIDFQDRSVARAFFITFRTFGAWLHGDERGSVDRRSKNRLGAPNIQSSPQLVWAETNVIKMNSIVMRLIERIVEPLPRAGY